MDQTRIVEWLNSKFSAFDYNLLSSLHNLAEITDGNVTGTFEVVGILSDKGVLLLLAGIVFFTFKSTRKAGFCLSGAVCCSAFLTLLFKDVIARPRPFVDAAGLYHSWWQYIAEPAESGFTFPSGHTTVAMAAATALFLVVDKKISSTSFIFVIITGISRCYLMVHYPSDILGGMIIGTAGAVITWALSAAVVNKAISDKPNINC